MQEPIMAEPQEASIFTFSMAVIQQVFEYDFAHARKLSQRYQTTEVILSNLEKLRDFIQESHLPEETKVALETLLQEEVEVLSFSQISRHSVIEL